MGASSARLRAWTVGIALLAACQRNFEVPAGTPTVSSFEPASAFAGSVVRLSGRDLGFGTDTTNIRFGTSGAVHPRSISADQTSAQVVVPDDATTGIIQI